MLQQVSNEHFQPLVDQPCPLHLPDGSLLPVQVESIRLRPQSQLPESSRVPFNVMLRSLGPTDFVDGLCALELPQVGRLDAVFVSREPPLGRDPALGYFNIVFN
ncbi:hypothetical protein CCU68_33430 [Pseudomonas gingeri NCPPB 3146 = LMG 5327]|uniref:DUF6916 domain-containing protein n=2 Tax=Pseudomonas gingeri TaxID=117681 RepID=A0A7Y7XZT5_9PSED|nr:MULTISPECIES: hypothetical protein [Pseudomonas]NVZ25418.1 hypothetical protein [Pseudomonas gingeri]NVZ65916.1 hypothetical protein [Pseudomonas gingeri]NVZ79875.1 hypothetical protein [Pseudomonas gingeri]NWA06948.1 hypothetical protein [Pseudomonas gingeri]NWC15369.1 hypothetical protein [Pseudomonas gingeri]